MRAHLFVLGLTLAGCHFIELPPLTDAGAAGAPEVDGGSSGPSDAGCVAVACSSPSAPCFEAERACGETVCIPSTRRRAAGTACGTNLVCTAGGECAACVEGAACAGNPGGACMGGRQSCTGEPRCVDGLRADAGQACGAEQVCDGAGACVRCIEGERCTTNPSACRAGRASCSAGPACVDDEPRPFAAACGSGMVCGLRDACEADSRMLLHGGPINLNLGLPKVAPADGGSYLAVNFDTRLTWGGPTFTSPAGAPMDFVLARLAPSGAVSWARTGADAGTTELGVLRLLTTPDDGAVVVGRFAGTLTLGAAAPLTTQGALVGTFVAKYTASGAVAWAVSVSTEPFTLAVALGPDGAVYVVATVGSTGALGLWKYDAQGAAVLATPIGTGDLRPEQLAIASDGTVWVAGAYHGTVAFGATMLAGPTAPGDYDAFLLKLTPAAATGWARVVASGPDSKSLAGLIALSDGSVIVGGHFAGASTVAGSAVTGRGGLDVFVTRYDGAGQPTWVRTGGGPGFDWMAELVLSDDGTLFATGYVNGDFRLGVAPALTSGGPWLLKLGTDGAVRAQRTLGSLAFPTSLAVRAGRVSIAGYSQDESTLASVTLPAAQPAPGSNFFLLEVDAP